MAGARELARLPSLTTLAGGERDAAVTGCLIVESLVGFLFALEGMVGVGEVRNFLAGAVRGVLEIEITVSSG